MKRSFLASLTFTALVHTATAQSVTFTNNATADSYLSANNPTLNFGGAGALEISGVAGTNAAGFTNGASDGLLRFNTAAMVANFNSNYSAGWQITGMTLKVTEQGAPSNTNFNRGAGLFEIRWIANDGWTEGTGTPNAPTTDGVSFNDRAALLNGGTDVSLGSAFANASANGLRTYALPLASSLVNDLKAGGDVSLFLTAVSADIGFNFDSRTFGTASARPMLEVTVVPEPGTITLVVCGGAMLLMVTARRHSRRSSE